MFFHVTIFGTKYNPPKHYKIYCRKYRFCIVMRFQNASESELHDFGNLIKEFVRTLYISTALLCRHFRKQHVH